MPRISELPVIGAVNDTSSFVGSGPGSGRFTGAAIKAYVGVVGGGGGIGSGPELATTLPSPLAGAAAVGTSTSAARADHAHARPTLSEIGAAPISHAHPQTDISGLTAQLSAKQDASDKGIANGYAPLDSSGKVPTSNLPTISGGGVTTLDGLSDVTVTSPAIGNTLRYNGSQFINVSLSISDVSGLSASLGNKVDWSQSNAPNGFAALNSSGKISLSQLPSGAALPENVVTTDYKAPVEYTPLVQDPTTGQPISAAYTAKDTDINKVKVVGGFSDVDTPVTLPNLPTGSTIVFVQDSIQKLSFVGVSGVTVMALNNRKRSAGQGAEVLARVIAAGLWKVSGEVIL